MKDYQEVVKNRFESEADNSNSIYAPNHPIGKYVRTVLYQGLSRYLLKYAADKGSLNTKKLLDVGCGSGGMIEFFISQGFSPQHITGVDLSKNRIEKAQKQNPAVTFIIDDALSYRLNKKFDLITAFDLFSHLTTKEQIMKGLQNVSDHLEDDGIFLWYDIFSKDHFSSAANADSWGFNKQQMIDFCNEAGFEMVYYSPFFKNFFNRYHSIYQVKRLSAGIIKLLEKTLPGTPGNLMLVFKKKTSDGN